MKVYLFYLIDKEMIQYLKELGLCEWLNYKEQEIEKGMLYGYTKSKKIAKAFWKSRDHTIFIKKEVELDFDEYQDLDIRSYNYGGIKEEKLSFLMDGMKQMIFPLTTAESWNVIESRGETINYYFQGYVDPINTSIFKKDLKINLRELGYNDWVTGDNMISEAEVLSKLERFTVHEAWKSEFGLFSFLYGDMLDYGFTLERMSEFEEKEEV